MIAVAGVASVAAQPVSLCGERGEIVERLRGKFSEVRIGVGMMQSGTWVEVYASPATGSWTIIETRQDGKACIRALGSDWHGLTEEDET